MNMPQAARVTDRMAGSVGHHNRHITGYRQVEDGEDEDGNTKYRQEPIYCSGHSVTGKQTKGHSKVMIQGQAAATVGDSGTSTCPCDGAGYTNVSGSSKVIIQGKPAVRLGDKVNIHGQGTGSMTSGSSKVIFS
jgi:uncharacterized Zn-binding protein involved in type VI secretion